jgi:hypothetical protein
VHETVPISPNTLELPERVKQQEAASSGKQPVKRAICPCFPLYEYTNFSYTDFETDL